MSTAPLRRLLVFLPARRPPASGPLGPATEVDYLAVPATAGAPRPGSAPLASLPFASRVDLVFDAADVFVGSVGAPRLSAARLRLALPNLVEEQLLGDPADTHLVAAPAGDGANLVVAGIDRGLLTRVLDACAQAGLRPHSAVSELFAVPPPAAGRISARVARARGVVRSGAWEGVAFDLDGELPVPLRLVVGRLAAQRLRVYGADAARLAAAAGALGLGIDDPRAELDLESLDAAPNLLQGPFAPAGRWNSPAGAFALLRRGPWRAAAGWAALCALIGLAGLNLCWLQLEAESEALRAGMRAAVRNAFPTLRTVVDPLAQTQRELLSLRTRAGVPSPDDFTVLDAGAMQVLAAVPLGLLSGLDYHDRVLRLRFKPGALDRAELQNTLRAQAARQGLELRFEADGSALLQPAAAGAGSPG